HFAGCRRSPGGWRHERARVMRKWETRGWIRSLPLGLIGMLGFVVAIERSTMHCAFLVPSANCGGVSWNFAPKKIKSKTRDREILCLGDSLVNVGVIPAILTEQTGRCAYNLALHGGAAPASYYLLRRAVSEGAHPSILVIDFERKLLAEGPSSRERRFPWTEVLSLRETVELAWT